MRTRTEKNSLLRCGGRRLDLHGAVSRGAFVCPNERWRAPDACGDSASRIAQTVPRMATITLLKRQNPGELHDGARPLGFYAPHWARYVVADRNGAVWAYERCPFVDAERGAWVNRVGNGRFGILGSHPGGWPDWRESLHYRKGGLWVCASDELVAESRRRLRDAVAGSLKFVVLMSAVVAAIQALWWNGGF